jgi:hypothetical protein
MYESLHCNTCHDSYIGHHLDRRECNICRASREAEARFEKEMAQRERHYNSSFNSSYSENTSYSENNNGMNVGAVTAGFIGAIVGLILMLSGVYDWQINIATVFISILFGAFPCFMVVGLLYTVFTE